MATATIEKALAEQHELAEQIRSDEPREVSLGKQDVLRQGDIYIARIPSLPVTKKIRKDRQLADGNTQGSRHVLTGDADLYDPDTTAMREVLAKSYPHLDVQDYQIGPTFETRGPVTVEHPEHGNRTLTEPGCYATVFQRSLEADGREARARD